MEVWQNSFCVLNLKKERDLNLCLVVFGLFLKLSFPSSLLLFSKTLFCDGLKKKICLSKKVLWHALLLVQFSCSVVSDSLRPHGLQHTRLPCLSITNTQSLLKLVFIKSVMPSNHPILSCPLLLLPSIFPSIRVFSNESVLHIRWPKYWSFSFSISPTNEYSGLISFRIDWFDLAVQGTLKSLFQHHSSKASILQCSPLWSNSHIHTWLLEKP